MNEIAQQAFHGSWQGYGSEWNRISPVTGVSTWQGRWASLDQAGEAIDSASTAHAEWARLPFESRCEVAQRYATFLEKNRQEIARTISLESGKPLWESLGEVSAAISKVALSIDAIQQRRSGSSDHSLASVATTRFQSLGVVLVIGPYNLPLHLPGAHVIPALLAGNTVVLKPSEYTPSVGDWIARGWNEAGLRNNEFRLIHGDATVSQHMIEHGSIAGVFFTGSKRAGLSIHRQLAGRPHVQLALEMGGNNSIVFDSCDDLRAAAEVTIQSAYLTSGQRCVCARRLIVVQSEQADRFIDQLAKAVTRIRVGDPLGSPEPFMGTLVSEQAANQVLHSQEQLLSRGADAIITSKRVNTLGTQLTPALLKVEEGQANDEEIFGPLLLVYRARDRQHAIHLCNATQYGLAAGLISKNREYFHDFVAQVRAGIINWNCPMTGASGKLPFGGLGLSGNHRPCGFYAADYCSDPVASLETERLVLADRRAIGLEALWTD